MKKYSFILLMLLMIFQVQSKKEESTTSNTNYEVKHKLETVHKNEQKILSKLKQNYLLHKKKFLQKPNPNLKKAYIKATLQLANSTLTCKCFPPKIKYPHALKLYREILKFEPKHNSALNSKNLIESIYKSMNRPIPK